MEGIACVCMYAFVCICVYDFTDSGFKKQMYFFGMSIRNQEACFL